MAQKISIEEAKSEYEKLKIELDEAEQALNMALIAWNESRREYDMAWYEYVRHATPENHAKFTRAHDALDHVSDHHDRSKLNYKLTKCRFKKAEKLYAKLQKKAAKKQKQPGEEEE